ncbi:MAG TPA: DUF4381 domain-containing protein [Planctomycetaceae bacterium]|nr:DUF4381 domain-containing protein [Planctomycetaceae bacterium]
MPNAPDQPLPATSLDLLHDLSLPQAVDWWPPAPGWFGVLFFLAIAVLVSVYRLFARYRAGAYRRAALRELETLECHTAIAELLRRTALAVVPRSVVADLTGGQWIEWLASRCSVPMPGSVREQLSQGVYRETDQLDDLRPLKTYAAHWISNHITSNNKH